MSGDPTQHSDRPPLILIANDQEWTARAIESILTSNGYQVVRAFTAREATDLAEARDPDLLILDLQLPDYSGIELCRRLRGDPRFGSLLPVIITTAGPSGRQQRLAAYQAGAWEFYGQPLDAEALLHKVATYHQTYRKLRRLRQDALTDGETGLYSRAGLVRRATELLGDARRSGREIACVAWLVPLSPGDAPMREIGAGLRRQARASDAVGRLSGGEFAAVALDTDPEGAQHFAERVQELIAATIDTPIDSVRTTVLAIDKAAPPADGGQLLERIRLTLAA